MTTPLLAAALLAAASGPPSPWQLAWLGELDGARAALAPDRAARPDEPGAFAVLACVELEAGRLAAADAAVARLEGLAQASPEARILRALVVRRREAPGEPMSEALARAWAAAGRPPLADDGPLARARGGGDLAFLFAVPAGKALESLPRGEAFLLGGAANPSRSMAIGDPRLPEALARWLADRQAEARALAAAPGPQPIALALVLHDTLRSEPEGPRLAAALAGAAPGDGYAAMEAALARGDLDQPLDEAALAAVEAAVAHPRLSPPTRPVLEAVRAAAVKLDPARAPVLAREAFRAVMPTQLTIYRLQSRALATRDPALRGRALRALGKAAATLKGDPGVAARETGYTVAVAREAGDKEGAATAEASRVRFRAWVKSVGAAMTALRPDRWPLASLRREWDPDREFDRAVLLAGPAPE